MTALIIWLIGYLFALGICDLHAVKRSDKFGISMILLILWPLFLGAEIRERLARRDTKESEQ